MSFESATNLELGDWRGFGCVLWWHLLIGCLEIENGSQRSSGTILEQFFGEKNPDRLLPVGEVAIGSRVD